MKATELRIGNIVDYKINDEIDKRKEWNEVNVIDALDLVAISQCEIANRDSLYFPILLTEEWMKKFGFIIEKGTQANSQAKYTDFVINDDEFDMNENFTSTIRSFRIYLGNKSKNYSIHLEAEKHQWFPSLKYFKYVHELQNLYYALAKRELVLAVTPINTKTNDC